MGWEWDRLCTRSAKRAPIRFLSPGWRRVSSFAALLPHARIFVLDGIAPGTAPALVAHRLTPVLNSLDEIAEWSARARSDRVELDAALHIDTGMNRSGLSHRELSELTSRQREALVGINLVLVISHLACADEPGMRK